MPRENSGTKTSERKSVNITVPQHAKAEMLTASFCPAHAHQVTIHKSTSTTLPVMYWVLQVASEVCDLDTVWKGFRLMHSTLWQVLRKEWWLLGNQSNQERGNYMLTPQRKQQSHQVTENNPDFILRHKGIRLCPHMLGTACWKVSNIGEGYGRKVM